MLRRWLSIVLVTLMFISNMPRNISVYAEEDPVVETVPGEEETGTEDEGVPAEENETVEDPVVETVPGEEETGTEDEGVPVEENETVVGEETPPDSGEGNDDVSEINEEAVYIVYEELEAVQVFGDAAKSPKKAAESLQETTSLDDDEIDETVEELFRDGENETQSDSTLPDRLDGSQIDTMTIKWITDDTVNNDDDSLLYIKPNGNETTSMRLQINYSLSGEHKYEPGDITIIIPDHIFKDRNGKNVGTVTIPYPEDPSTKGDFNWKKVGNNYILTNTKKMSAATKGYMQIELGGITPNQIKDMEETNPFDVKIEVVTWKGNLMGKTSNALTAQLDTEARINSVTKGVSTGSPRRVQASAIPAQYRIEGETEYVLIDWWIRSDNNANTMYNYSFEDVIPNTIKDLTTGEEIEIEGFIINHVENDARQLNYTSGNQLGYGNSSSTSHRIQVAYPASPFIAKLDPNTGIGHRYEFKNSVTAKVTEYDPEQKGNPNVQATDPKLVTVKSTTATTTFLFRDPQFIEPTGHFFMNKNGNDGKPKGNYTHWSSGSRNDQHLGSEGYYGIYSSALNEIIEGKSIQLSYTINTRAYLMPWTYEAVNEGKGEWKNKLDENGNEVLDEDGNNIKIWVWEINPRMIKDNYFRKDLTVTTTDTGMWIDSTSNKLEVLKDYTIDSVEILEPWVYTGIPKNISNEGNFVVMSATDGTFEYTRDNNKANYPDIVLEILRDGETEWETYKTISFKNGDGAQVINLPAGTVNFRTTVTSHNAAINYDVRPVITLKNTDALKEIVQNKFAASTNPRMSVYNSAVMNIDYTESEEDVFEMSSNGYDSLRGYTTDVWVTPSKKAKQLYVDYENNRVKINFETKIYEETKIPELSIYNEAVSSKRLLHETSGIFRDLLPLGISPILESIKLRSGDSIKDVYTIENYNDSGRTLLVVEANLKVAPESYSYGDTYYYRDVPRLSFDAWYDFDSIKDYGDRIHNVIAFESGNDKLGTIDGYKGEPDNTSTNNNKATKGAFANNSEKTWMNDLDKTNDDPNFVYAGAPLRIDILYKARTSLNKDVDVNNEGYYSSGVYYEYPEDNKRIVYEGGQYNYRLRMMSDTGTITKNMILYDFLEVFRAYSDDHDPIDVDAKTWSGYLREVDVSQLEDMGCAPVVYYATNATLEGYQKDLESSNEDRETLLDLNSVVWIKESDYTGNLNDVAAIAIDARKKADGSDFELQPEKSISAIVRMQAPSGEIARQAMSDESKGAWGDSAMAYNNAYLLAKSIDVNSGTVGDDDIIRKDYTKVGLKEYNFFVEKKWNDDNNRDGIRTDSVTFNLLANGVPSIDENGKARTVTVNEGTGWKGEFDHIPYTDENGDKIRYSVEEVPITGYTPTFENVGNNTTKVTNKHIPEKISISGTKTWKDDEIEDRPASITVQLYGNGKEVKKLVVKPDNEGDWNYEFTDLFKYENGQPIVYTIKEVREDGKVLSYKPTVNGFDIVNEYHPFGELYVDKTLIDTTAVAADKQFTFVFSFSKNNEPIFDEYDYDIIDKETKEVLRSGKISSEEGKNKIKIKASERIHVKEIEEYVYYTVEEENLDGFRLTDSANTSGTIVPNLEEPIVASFTNTYSANGTFSPEVTKVLKDRVVQKYQFVFELYDDKNELLKQASISDKGSDLKTIENEEETSDKINIGDNVSEAKATFGAFRYTQEDAGKTYTYTVKEKNTNKQGYTYDGTVYTVDVAIADNGDGTLTITPTYKKNGETVKPIFVNEYKANGEVKLRTWKELKGAKLEADKFEFAVFIKDKGGNETPFMVKVGEETRQLTAKNKADGTVDFNPITYTEKDINKEYVYVVKEVVPEQESDTDPIIYARNTKVEYTVKVIDNGDGTLSTDTTIRNYELKDGQWVKVGDDNEVPLFVNEMKDGTLTVSKFIQNPEEAPENQKNQTFHFKVKLIGEDIKDGQIEYHIVGAGESLPGTNNKAELKDGVFEFNLHGGEKAIFEGIPADTAYQVWEETLDGWILVGQENVSGKIEALQTVNAKFTNKYEPGSTSVQFFGTKLLDGFAAEKDSFRFELYEGDEKLEEVAVLDGGFIQFSPISYITAGEHDYVVKEIIDANNETIRYDTHEEEIHVSVTKEGDGLRTRVTYDDGAVRFENFTNPGSLRISKTTDITTDNNKDDEFQIKVTFTNEKGIPLSSGEQIEYYIIKEASNTDTTSTETPDSNNNTEPVENNNTEDNNDNTSYVLPAFRLPKLRLVNKIYAEEGDIASGTREGLSWRIDKDGNLILGKAGQTQTMSNIYRTSSTYYYPWLSYRDRIKTVRVEGKVIAQGSLQGMFYSSSAGWANTGSYPNLTSIDLTGMDTKNVTNMSYMFAHNHQLQTITQDFNTSNVTTMEAMFQACTILTTVDVSKWNTSKVTTMSYMFGDSNKLDNIDVSNWNTSKVTNMYALFWSTGITSIDVSKWNTSRVTNMQCLFGQCYYLKSIDVSSFDTRNVTTMGGMFRNDRSLETLDLSNFNTDKVTNFLHTNGTNHSNYHGMFAGCTNLRFLDISGFNTDHSTNMTNMFNDCPKLNEVVLGSKFRFKDNAKLPTPPETESTGKWIDVTNEKGAKTPTELYNSYTTGWQNTWVWEIDNSNARVNFNGNGGSVTIPSVTLTDGETAVTTPRVNQTRYNGYILTGWNTQKNGQGTNYEPGQTYNDIAVYGKTIILYAQWEETDLRNYVVNHYRENITSSGHSLYESDYLMDTKGKSVTPDRKSYEGYITPKAQTVTIREDGNTVVNYYYDLIRYNIKYDGNGATSGSMNDEKNVLGLENHALRANIYAKTGSRFIGWSTVKDGDIAYVDGQKVRNLAGDDMTLYAVWLSNETGPVEPQAGEVTITLKKGETVVFPNLPSGTKYTIEEINLPAGWKLNEIDGPTGTIKSNEISSANVSNEYIAEGMIYLYAHKRLDGKELKENEFAFELYRQNDEGEWEKIDDSRNDAIDTNETTFDDDGNEISNIWKGTGLIQFNEITFNQNDIGKDLKFMIKEIVDVDESDNSLTYDIHEEEVTVHVEDSGKGILVGRVQYDDDGPLFVNTLNPGTLTVEKKIEDPDNKLPENDQTQFQFTLELKDKDGNDLEGSYDVYINETKQEEPLTKSPYSFKLKANEKLKVEGLPDGTAYHVKEERYEIDWEPESDDYHGTIVAGETSAKVFTNKYVPKAIEPEGDVVLKVKKVFVGDTIKESDNLQFELIDSKGNVIQTKGVDEFGETESYITFDSIHYDKDDKNRTFTYFIREVAGEQKDVRYDDTAYQVDVKLVDDGTRQYVIEKTYWLSGRVQYEEDEKGEYKIDENGNLIPIGNLKEEELVFTNYRMTDLVIQKEIESYELGTPMSVVFEVIAEFDGKIVYDKLHTLEFTNTNIQKFRIENLPVGAKVTVKEVYGGSSYVVSGDSDVVIESLQKAEPDDDVNIVKFMNAYSDEHQNGAGLNNIYNRQDDGDWDVEQAELGGRE